MPYLDRHPLRRGYTDAETGKDAAPKQSKADALRERCMKKIEAAGLNGLTSEELADALQESYASVQPRTSELRKADRIMAYGRRKMRSGRTAHVWVAVIDWVP